MGKNNKPYTTESFKIRLKELGRDDIEVLGEYKNSKTKIKVRCTNLECRYEWEVVPYSLLEGCGCPKCALRKRSKESTKTHEEFMKEFKEKGSKNIIILGEYKNAHTTIECTCKIHKDIKWFSNPQTLLNGRMACPECIKSSFGAYKKYDHEEFVRKFEEKGNKNVILIGKYEDFAHKISCKCKNNENHVWEAYPNDLLHGKGCPYCTGRKVSKDNCFASYYPDLVKYFENPEDAYTITYGSKKIVRLICPDCHSIKETPASNLSKNGFSCPICGDGISYPNKFIRNMLIMLGIDFKPEWTNKKCKGCLYDVEFEINGKIYLVEMDGDFHYFEQGYGTLADVQAKDKIKNQKAKENGWHLVRIKSLESNPEYLFNNIKNSELGKIFDLKDFDYVECGRRCEKSLMIEVCNYVNNHITIHSKELSKIFKLNIETINNYIKRGKELGLINKAFVKKNNSKLISVYKSGKLIKTYISITECANKLFEDFGIKVKSRDKLYRIIKSNKSVDEIYTFKIVQSLDDIE